MALYKGFSNSLGKTWVVSASGVREATAISIKKYLTLLSSMEKEAGRDIDVDFRFEELKNELLELT